MTRWRIALLVLVASCRSPDWMGPTTWSNYERQLDECGLAARRGWQNLTVRQFCEERRETLFTMLHQDDLSTSQRHDVICERFRRLDADGYTDRGGLPVIVLRDLCPTKPHTWR